MLTHANLLANIRAIVAGAEVRPSDVAVSWLPLYHDMGLIGAWLMPLYFGHAGGGDVAAGVFEPAGAMAARDSRDTRNDQSGAEFRVRAVRAENSPIRISTGST